MEVKDLVEYIKEVKQKTEELESAMDKKMQEEKELKKKADSKIDKTSGFYKDIENEIKAKHSEWNKAFNERENYKNHSSEKINNMKEELISQLEETANQIDENRHLKKDEIEQKVNEGYQEVKELNSKLYSKKQELKYFESTIPESNKDKKKIINRKQGEIDSLDNQIQRKISNVQEIQKMSKEEPEKLYNDIKKEIEYIKKLTIENIKNEEQKIEEKGSKVISEKPEEKEPEEKESKVTSEKPEEKELEEKESKVTSEKPEEKEPEEKESKIVSEKPEEKKTEVNEPSKKEAESEKNNEPSQFEEIFSNSKDRIKSIYIETSTGKAYINTTTNNNEIDIKEAIENRKELYKRIDIKKFMQNLGINSKIQQFALKRKINPVILQAIHKDEDLTAEYIDCLIENRKFPFEYKNSLKNSSLSNKDTAFMNKIALKESKIEENEIVGAEKLYKIKTFFRNIKNKANNRFEARKVEMLNEAEDKEKNKNESTKSKKEEFYNRIEKYNEQSDIQKRADKIVVELEKKYDEAYNSLSDKQKSELKNMSVGDVQKLGFDYSTSVALKEKQDKNNDEKDNER